MQVKRILSGLTVITVGLILLANTTGYLPWAVWLNILSLWPLLLVAAGIDIIGRTTDNAWLRALASIVLIGGLAYGALVMPVAGPSGFLVRAPSGKPYSFSEPHNSMVTHGTANVSSGLSKMSLRGGYQLATAEGVSPFGTPTFAVQTSGTSASVNIKEHGPGPVVIAPNATARMDVMLDRSVVWDFLEVSSGLSDNTIDTSDFEVTRSQFSVGLASTTITYGRKSPDANTQINGGLGSLRVRFPGNAAVELVAHTGLGSLNVPAGWTRVDGSGAGESVWHSPSYGSSSAPKIRAELNAGLGSVDVETY